ncbi:MAG: hypothetical protein EBS38_07925, partial [Actinobacteria bacterium]|nr:hypothetical protein [Actinomycetota bacterium]
MAEVGYVSVEQIAAPVVSSIEVATGYSNPTSQTNFRFQVTFSSAVTDFTVADIDLLGIGGVSTWTETLTPVAGSSRSFIIDIAPSDPTQVPDGNLQIRVNATGVKDSTGNFSGNGNMTSPTVGLDRVRPTISSSSLVPTSTPGQLRLSVTYSETVTSSLNWSAFAITGSSLTWTTQSAAVSGSTFTTLLNGTSLVSDTDLVVQISQALVSDAAGNTSTGSAQITYQIRGSSPVATLSSNITAYSQSLAVNLSFDQDVFGLAASDFVVSPSSLSCSVGTPSGSGSNYSVVISGCGSNRLSEVSVSLRVGSVGNFIGIVGPLSTASIQVTLDSAPPTANVVSKVQSGTSVIYQLEISETVSGLVPTNLVFSRALGSDWTISGIVRQPGTNIFVFHLSAPQIDNGNLSFTISPVVIDLAGNPVSNSGLASSSLVTISAVPFYDPGGPGTLAASGSPISPLFELNSRASGIAGIRIAITNAQPGDSLVFSNQNSITGTLTASNSILLLEGANSITDSTWETAIRSITFSSTNNAPVARNIEYHLSPLPGYDFVSGALFLSKARANTNYAQAVTAASQEYLFGMQGYLATPSTPSQQLAAGKASAATAIQYNWLGVVENEQQGGGITWSNGIARDMALTFAGFNAWETGEPNNPGDVNIHNWNYTKTNAFGTFPWSWNDNSATFTTGGFLVEFGLRGNENLPSELRKTQSHTVDLTAPTIERVFGSSDTYGRGETLDLNVQFSEPVTVAGTPVSRIEILPGKFATYQSGSGTDTLVYRYVVESGVTASDLAYVSTSSLQIQSQTIRDSAGNNAVLTLPALGALGSLNYESNIVLDGTSLRVTLTATATQSSQTSVQFRVASAVAISCASLTQADFGYTNLISSSMVVGPAGNSTSCTISISHSIPKASFGTVRLAPTGSFEITLSDNSTHSALVIRNNSILVTMAPDPGKGEVIVDESNLTRQRPTSL